MPDANVSPTVVAELQRQMNHELTAAHAYTAMAAWCYQQNLKGFSDYFLDQAEEERGHAQRLMDHMMARGVAPAIGAVGEPVNAFDGPLGVAMHAREMERRNTEGVHAAYRVAVEQDDLPAQIMLQWFINEQVEEEDWANEMVERVRAAGCAGATAELDRHLRRYLDKGFAESKNA